MPANSAKRANGGRKIDAITPHHKTEDVAADVARPAFPSLTFLIDGHRRTTVVVPGATGNKVTALRLQLQRGTDDINDVNGATHSLFQVEVRGEGQTTTPLKGSACSDETLNRQPEPGPRRRIRFFPECFTYLSWRNLINRSTRRLFLADGSLPKAILSQFGDLQVIYDRLQSIATQQSATCNRELCRISEVCSRAIFDGKSKLIVGSPHGLFSRLWSSSIDFERCSRTFKKCAESPVAKRPTPEFHWQPAATTSLRCRFRDPQPRHKSHVVAAAIHGSQPFGPTR